MPHIQAEYQGQVAVYSIPDKTVLAGEVPAKKHKLVVAWIEILHEEDGGTGLMDHGSGI